MNKKIVFFASLAVVLMLVRAHGDTIFLDGGGSVRGEIIKETLDEIVVRDPLRGITTTINKDNIMEIRRAEGLEKEYHEKLKQIIPGDTYAMLELADWCRKCSLKEYQRDLLKRILEIYPDDPDAKRELDILEGRLPESARTKKKKESEGITFASGEGDLKGLKKPRKTRNIWGERDSGASVKRNPSKLKPKNSTRAGKRGLDWLLKHGTRIDYAPTGQVVSAALAGMACLASRDNKYSRLLDRCVRAVKSGVKRYITGKRQRKGRFNQANWALAFGGFFLIEALPFYKSKELKKLLQEVCAQLAINQEKSGGYGHDASGPCPSGYIEMELMSNFVVACMGMCKREGIPVPKAKFEKAIEYIERCVSRKGVRYSHTKGAAHVSRTGGAIFALSMADHKENKYPVLCKQMDRYMDQVLYGHATPSLSFFQCAVGSLQVGPEVWDKYVQTWFKKILEHQNADGSFRPIRNPKEPTRKWEAMMGPAFCTAVYSFVLLVDLGNLKYASGCSRGK